MNMCHGNCQNCAKVVMQGKLIAVTYCVHIESSSPWAEFVNTNKCICVCLVSEKVKSIKF